MLVLSRKQEEKIVIGDGSITITVIKIQGDKVQLGIKAPKEVSIHRKEILDEVNRETNEIHKK